MFALTEYRRKICPDCGTHQDDAEAILEHFEPGLWRCKVCEKGQARMKEKRESGGSMLGLRVKFYPILDEIADQNGQREMRAINGG